MTPIYRKNSLNVIRVRVISLRKFVNHKNGYKTVTKKKCQQKLIIPAENCCVSCVVYKLIKFSDFLL